jgi:CspA family cold shock protein
MGGFLMNHGTVKFFNTTRGFGFISNDDGGDDVFVHVSALTSQNGEALAEGQKVTFDIERDAKNGKLRAANVSIVK